MQIYPGKFSATNYETHYKSLEIFHVVEMLSWLFFKYLFI